MQWWSPSPPPPKRSDAEIVAYVDAMVARGEIKPEQAPHYARALRDVADGKAVSMNDLLRSAPEPTPPRRTDGRESQGRQTVERRGSSTYQKSQPGRQATR
jgi:hypothetical protein